MIRCNNLLILIWNGNNFKILYTIIIKYFLIKFSTKYLKVNIDKFDN